MFRRVHDIDLHPSAAPSFFFFLLDEEDSTAAVFPQQKTPDVPSPIAVEKFSRRRNIAIRHRDSVKSNEENVFTRDRVLSWSRDRGKRDSLDRIDDKSPKQRFMTVSRSAIFLRDSIYKASPLITM